jgi:hypothetical protein
MHSRVLRSDCDERECRLYLSARTGGVDRAGVFLGDEHERPRSSRRRRAAIQRVARQERQQFGRGE